MIRTNIVAVNEKHSHDHGRVTLARIRSNTQFAGFRIQWTKP